MCCFDSSVPASLHAGELLSPAAACQWAETSDVTGRHSCSYQDGYHLKPGVDHIASLFGKEDSQRNSLRFLDFRDIRCNGLCFGRVADFCYFDL